MESTKFTAPPAPKRRAGTHPDEYGATSRPVLPLGDREEVAAPERSGNGHGTGHDEVDLAVTPPRPAWLIVAAVVGIVALLSLLVAGLLPRQRAGRELAADAQAALNAPVLVSTTQPTRASSQSEISMPGNLRPWQEVSIYARTTGYLKKFYVDISNQVEAGQLMAEIETPEVDQQLRQAQAAVLQAKAATNLASTNRDLSKVTYERYEKLRGTNSVTLQDIDTKKAALAADEANLEAAKANVAAAEANVQRLTQMQQFEKVVAPFAGVVSGRGYDVGSLILADPTNVDVKPMYKIAENDVLRVFVNVPQSSALQIRKGMEVKVAARELPGKTFTGTVMGTTNYLDQTNRSLLTEVKVQNVKGADGEFMLLPGMYVQVSFVVKHDAPPLLIPAPALIGGTEGNQVAVLRDGAIHFVPVELGQDYGATIEVVKGLTGDEQIIANPGERVVDGAPAKAATEKE